MKSIKRLIMPLMAGTALLISCTLPAKNTSYGDLFSFCGDKDYVSPNNVSVKDAQNQSQNLKESWWKETSFYHIWLKSFYDSDGDGCGDIKGVTQKLDYIQNNAGCDGIWLSPFFDCNYKTKSGNMHGYDSVDYYTVNDYFGTEDDLIELINACHEREMKIIFDFVPNHTSFYHPWLTQSFYNQNNKGDWYLWNDTKLSWNNSMNTENWFEAYDENDSKYYYGAFGSSMPDLNFRNYEVREEMKNVVRYWLNKGFDGLRADAVRYLIENKTQAYDTDESHGWFKELREEIDKYDSPKFMIAEAWITGNRTSFNKYFGNEDEFNMLLDFDQGTSCISSVKNQSNKIKSTLYPNQTYGTGYGTFLVNHDEYNDRIATTFTGDSKKQKLVTALSLLRPTVPFIYYGTEAGLMQTNSSGDIRMRGSFDWDSIDEQISTEDSLLNCNKALNTLRKAYPEDFADSTVTFLNSSDSSFACYLMEGKQTGNKFLCVFNLSNSSAESAVFTQCSSFSSSELLVGDTDSPLLTYSDSTVTVKNLAPLAYRVYLLDGNGKAKNYWDDETYVKGQTYSQEDNGSYATVTYTVMYLRGSFNNWGADQMYLSSDGQTFYCYITFTSSGSIEYKFCVTDTSEWGDNWGANGGSSNISQTVTSGTYYVTFNPYTKKYTFTKCY